MHTLASRLTTLRRLVVVLVLAKVSPMVLLLLIGLASSSPGASIATAFAALASCWSVFAAACLPLALATSFSAVSRTERTCVPRTPRTHALEYGETLHSHTQLVASTCTVREMLGAHLPHGREDLGEDCERAAAQQPPLERHSNLRVDPLGKELLGRARNDRLKRDCPTPTPTPRETARTNTGLGTQGDGVEMEGVAASPRWCA